MLNNSASLPVKECYVSVPYSYVTVTNGDSLLVNRVPLSECDPLTTADWRCWSISSLISAGVSLDNKIYRYSDPASDVIDSVTSSRVSD